MKKELVVEPETTDTGKKKRTRKPNKKWPVMLAVKKEDFKELSDIDYPRQNAGIVYVVLPEITGEETKSALVNFFTCDGEALAIAALIPKFIAENAVHTIRVSDRIILKPRKIIQTKMQFK